MTLNDLMYGLEGLLTGNSIKSKVYGEGIITHITGNNPNDLIVHIQCGKIKKAFNLAIALKTKNITFLNEDTLYVYNQYMEAAKEVMEEEARIAKEKKLEEERIRREEEARKEAEKEAKKAAQAFERTKKRMIEKFEEMTHQTYSFDTYGEQYYYSIGWLASHIKTVSAALPDYLEDSFIRYFGADTPRSVVDSSKKTVGGFSSQWSYSFNAGLRDPDNAPVLIQENMNPTSKRINSTSFLWELIDNMGFRFGKTQDIDEIRSHVPNDMLIHFELGYNT